MIKNNQSGFSLTELIVGMAVGIIIISVSALTLANTINIVNTGNSNIDLLQESRWALSLMSQDIRSGYSISSPANNTAGNSITFVKPNNLNQTITYSVINNEICRQVGSGKNYPVTNSSFASINTQNFSITNVNNTSLKINMTFSKSNTSQNMSDTIFLMNNSARIGGN